MYVASVESVNSGSHRHNRQWDRVFCNIMQPLSLSGRGKVPFKSCGRLSADNGPVRVPHCHLTCPLGLGGPGWGYCLGGKRWWGLRGVGESGRGRRACGARPSPPSGMPRHLLPLWSFLYTLRLLIFARRLLAPCVWCAYSWMIVVRGRAGMTKKKGRTRRALPPDSPEEEDGWDIASS